VVIFATLLLALPGSAAARSYLLPEPNLSFYVDVSSGGGAETGATVSWGD
jgi:hypothetical protein